MTQTPLLPAPVGVADVQAGLAASRARRHRDSERIAMLSVQLIAVQVRAALPEAATVGLSEADEDSSRFPDGYYTATGDEIGLTADGLQAASPELAALLLALTEAIRPWCTNLNDGNRSAWEPFTSDLDPKAGTRLDFWQLRLDIVGVLAAREGTQARCGCPATAQTTVGGVLLTGHQAGCGQAEPRQYVWLWQEAGQLATGTLPPVRRGLRHRARRLAPITGPQRGAPPWGATYEVAVEPLADKPDQDGCWPVRLSVPGEQVTTRVWAC
jgi:hypothetical protein